ncbi:hypothetical protein [Nocardia sp. NBC_01388]|uniref:hypothetical protein n=1 Tax=Nocardia sp. NBC_01388 TaxID=2903596 RepID=UPI002F91B2BC
MSTIAYVGFACFVAAVTVLALGRRRSGPRLTFIPAVLGVLGSVLTLAGVLPPMLSVMGP